ncbi:hypothetical protein [Segeticoccus rhizosphaerae]|uniref:hypothetical protein n=1 Tax=Segeticoccus rhizosphaerae TaxID=1104777 RepID=UPI001263EF15|nr:hypothetical protein [Segeticoccus rhizosphaerae]
MTTGDVDRLTNTGLALTLALILIACAAVKLALAWANRNNQPPPVEASTFTNTTQCVGTNATGSRCQETGTYGINGARYCHAHAHTTGNQP